jgi:hypothetical protein
MSESLGKLMGTDYPFTVISSAVFGVILAYLLVRICLSSTVDKRERENYALLVLLGCLIGWAIGMFLIPYPGEKEQFDSLGKTVSAFFSGYVVSKLDRLLDSSLYSEKKPNPNAWFRLGIFTASALLAVIFVAVNRQYLVNNSKHKVIVENTVEKAQELVAADKK